MHSWINYEVPVKWSLQTITIMYMNLTSISIFQTERIFHFCFRIFNMVSSSGWSDNIFDISILKFHGLIGYVYGKVTILLVFICVCIILNYIWTALHKFQNEYIFILTLFWNNMKYMQNLYYFYIWKRGNWVEKLVKGHTDTKWHLIMTFVLCFFICIT